MNWSMSKIIPHVNLNFTFISSTCGGKGWSDFKWHGWMNSSINAVCASGATVRPSRETTGDPWRVQQQCQPAAPGQGRALNPRLLGMENAYTFPAPSYNIPLPSPSSSCPIPGTPRSLWHVLPAMPISFKFHSYTPSHARVYYICWLVKKNKKKKKKNKNERKKGERKKERRFKANIYAWPELNA